MIAQEKKIKQLTELQENGVADLGTWFDDSECEYLLKECRSFDDWIQLSESSKYSIKADIDDLPQVLKSKIKSFEKSTNLKFEQMYFVEHQSGAVDRNDLFHFDSVPKTKLMIHLSGDEKSRTNFVVGSHKWFWPRLNNLLYSKLNISLAKKGCQWLPGYNKNDFKEAVIFDTQVVIFNTNTYHRSGDMIEPRSAIIIHFT